MFYLGDKIETSPELTYSSDTESPHTSTYTKKDYCADEIGKEVDPYKAKLERANAQIFILRREVSDLKKQQQEAEKEDGEENIFSTPTPVSEATPTPTQPQL